MTHRYDTQRTLAGRAARSLGSAAAALTLAFAAPPEATAQVEEGISLGITPSAERLYWNDDLALDGGWYWGGRASLNFGPFVALEGYYLEGEDPATSAPDASLDDARRYGGDVVFRFADRDLSPSARVGAGLSEFGVVEGGTSEMLTGTAALGVEFQVFDRLQTRIFAQDVAFRVSASSPLVAADRISEGGTETLHNLSLGAGVDLFLGGRSGQEEGDRTLDRGLHGVASPLELYGGEIHWSGGVGLPDLPVAGARMGIDFGPYVGLRGYYFGSVDDGFGDFTDYFGYGAEGRFNLTRSDEAFTPFLVLGGGRMHFPDGLASAAGFDDATRWHAVAGGGMGFNLTERLRVEASARDMMLATTDPANVTAPDQLEHSWIYTGGIRFAIGGDVGGPDAPGMPDPLRGDPVGDAAPDAAGQPDRVSASDSLLAREMDELRARMDSLLGMLDADRGMARSDARTFELPVLESGEIYVRFGESGTFEPRSAADREMRAFMMMERLDALRSDLKEAPRGEERDSLRARLRELEERSGVTGASRDERSTLEARVERLRERVDALLEERAPDPSDNAPRDDRDAELELRMDVSLTPQVQTSPRGVLQGAPFRLRQLSPFTGPGFGEPGQLHVGVKADVGSAFGGSGRFVPQLSFGFIDAFSWSANAHVEWPLPFRIGEASPYVGTGLGLRDQGGLDLLLPNFVIGATYPLDPYHLFGAVQGLDVFDDTRLVVGFHTRAPFEN